MSYPVTVRSARVDMDFETVRNVGAIILEPDVVVSRFAYPTTFAEVIAEKPTVAQ